MNETIEWIPLNLFYILYPKGDFWGNLLAYVSLVPYGIIVAFVTLTLFIRDLHIIFFFGGQLANETLNLILKRMIGQQRPVQIPGLPHSNKSYGMPSQHCQFMAFYSVYCCLFIIYRLTSKSSAYKSFLLTVIISSLSLVTYSRIYLLYHFWSQCIVGLIIGFVCAVFWFFAVNTIIEPLLFDTLLKLKISQNLCLCNGYAKTARNLKSE